VDYLRQVAQKKGSKDPAFSSNTRLQALKALTQVHRPEAWRFLQDMRKEENSELRKALEKIMQEKSSGPTLENP
jgi:hypothetical protein